MQKTALFSFAQKVPACVFKFGLFFFDWQHLVVTSLSQLTVRNQSDLKSKGSCTLPSPLPRSSALSAIQKSLHL